MNPEISIIMPIYNTEKYLSKSIESLINQTFTNIEIILVNDGSVDNSYKICKEFENKDKRVKLITKENGGQGSARNRGLEIARGKCIAFIDSDDYIEATMYEKMYNTMLEYDCDIVACQVNMIDEDRNIISSTPNISEHGNIESGEDAIKRYLKYGRWGPCDKLYKREVIDNVRFIENRSCSEDHSVMIPILNNTNKMVTIEDYLYNYLVRQGSTTNSIFSIKNFDSAYIWEHVLKQARNISNKQIIEQVEAKVLSCYIDLINEAIRNKADQYDKEIKLIVNKIKDKYKNFNSNNYLLTQYKIGGYIISKNFNLYKSLFKISRKLKK